MTTNNISQLELLQLIIQNIPANCFFKDTQGRYQIASDICKHISGESDDFSIVGKTDLDIQPDKVLGKKFYDEDMLIVEKDIELSYIQKMTFGDEDYYYEIIRRPVKDASGLIYGIIGMVKDMTAITKLNQQIERNSIIDQLTSVYNRNYLYQWIEKELPNITFPLSIFTIDCNGLKHINDNYGHSRGDDLLKMNAVFFEDQFRCDKTIIRLGGDEFLILCPNMTMDNALALIKRAKKAESQYDCNSIVINNAYGVYTMNSSTEDFNEALKISDFKMYNYKKRNK